MIDRSDHPPVVAFHAQSGIGTIALRAISLALALVLFLTLMLSPRLFAGEELVAQVIMPVMLLGIAAATAYGVGIKPRSSMLATMLGPLVSWPLMMSSLALLAFRVT